MSAYKLTDPRHPKWGRNGVYPTEPKKAMTDEQMIAVLKDLHFDEIAERLTELAQRDAE